MWLSAEVIRGSFERLRMNVAEGKVGLERSSGLLYFLSFDACCRSQAPLSFDPNTSVGHKNREAFATEYSKMVTLKLMGHGKFLCTNCLGEITRNGTPPDKRASSNFLTVPLKKASQRQSPLDYPKRPARLPLLRLGPGLAGGNWGVAVHPDWPANLHKYLSERLTRAPFTDLAVFLLRDEKIESAASLTEALINTFSRRFSPELASYWSEQMLREERLGRGQIPVEVFSETYHCAFDDKAWVERNLARTEEESLKLRISYLEGLLLANAIPFNK